MGINTGQIELYVIPQPTTKMISEASLIVKILRIANFIPDKLKKYISFTYNVQKVGDIKILSLVAIFNVLHNEAVVFAAHFLNKENLPIKWDFLQNV